LNAGKYKKSPANMPAVAVRNTQQASVMFFETFYYATINKSLNNKTSL
jgi:hypothetical protein